MPIMKNVLGLDVGSHTVKAVELRQTLRALEPVQLRVHPRVDPDAPLSELLRRFVKMHQLPTDAVFTDAEGSYVLRVSDDLVARTRVGVGRSTAVMVEISHGLSEGDSVVVGPAKGLVDGDSVRVRSRK